MKKIFWILVFLMIFPNVICATSISKNDVGVSTYIIGKYMFTRNATSSYDGALTTKRIMLAAKSIDSNKESDMIIYYKKPTGTWIDALTGKSITPPNSFEIEVTDLNKTLALSYPTEDAITYNSNQISNSTYVIGKYMFTRNTNSNYDGSLTTKRIMLAAKSIDSNKESDMIICYKKPNGDWIDALSGQKITDIKNFNINTIDLVKQSVDKTAPTVSDIGGGTNLKATSQSLTLKCTDTVGVVAYYWGTTEPTAASGITTTAAADIASLKGTAGLVKTVNADGTYWLGCKDAAGNYAKKSIVIRKYQVNNLLETIAGVTGSYTNGNYKSVSTGTYIVKSGTTLTLASIYTIPTGGATGTFKGYSTSYGTSTATPNTSNPTIATNNTTVYYMWFNRNTYKVTINKPTNGSIKAETVTKTGNSATASTAAATLTAKYGDTVKATATPATGYNFTGWSGGYISGSINPTIGATITAAKEISATFAVATYKITYNTNGGNGTINPTTYTYTTSGTTNLSNVVPSRSGYMFLGWSTNSSATDATYAAGQSWNLNNAKDYTLYAIWALIGDTNRDGIINITDVISLLKHLSGVKTLSNIQKKLGDVDSDNYLSQNDALVLQKYVSGFDITLGSTDNQVKNMIPGDFDLQKGLTDDDISSFEDFLDSPNSELAPYIKKGMDLNGDSKIDTNDLQILQTIVSKNFNLINIDDLLELKKGNNINDSDDYVAEESSATINGVTFDVYYVFDIKTQYNEVSNMKTYAQSSFEYLQRVDQKILKKLKDNGTKLIFFGSYKCDNGIKTLGYYTYSAYCNSINRNIVMGYSYERIGNDYYHKSLIHEAGHAYDFTIYNLLTGDTGKGMSSLTATDIQNGFKNSSNLMISPSKFSNYFYSSNSWITLAENDSNNLKNKLSGFSGYSVEDLKSRPHEYFADIFKNYYLSSSTRSQLQSIAPNSYQAIVKAVNTTIQ